MAAPSVGEQGPELVTLPAGATIIPAAGFVVCTKDHVCLFFGEVPKGSRWHADHPVVADHPANFKKER